MGRVEKFRAVQLDADVDTDIHVDGHRVAFRDANAVANTYSHAEPDSFARRVPGGRLERGHRLCRRAACFVQRADLPGEVVDAGRQPIAVRAMGRLAGSWDLHIDAYADGIADTNGNCDSNCDADFNTDCNSHDVANAEPNTCPSARFGRRSESVQGHHGKYGLDYKRHLHECDGDTRGAAERHAV
jgi:hypothetical protein